MKQRRRLAVAAAAALAVALLALPVAAGEKGKCTADTQTCLNKMAAMFKDRGWIGIEMEEKKDSGLPVVNRIVAGSPAEAAGLEEGDIITAVDGTELTATTPLDLVVSQLAPGQTASLEVLRDGQTLTLSITLGTRPADL